VDDPVCNKRRRGGLSEKKKRKERKETHEQKKDIQKWTSQVEQAWACKERQVRGAESVANVTDSRQKPPQDSLVPRAKKIHGFRANTGHRTRDGSAIKKGEWGWRRAGKTTE